MPHSPSKKKEAYDLKNVRVLVVEDFPFMADLMTSMLREFNVGKVLAVCTTQEAKEALKLHNINSSPSSHFDLIITDLIPPKDDGLEFMQWVRHHEEESIQFLPILFSSAHANINVVTAGRDKGANEIMVKPLSAEKLAHRLLHIIDKPRPYVKAPVFFGPDRRRKEHPNSGTERRTTREEDMIISHEAA